MASFTLWAPDHRASQALLSAGRGWGAPVVSPSRGGPQLKGSICPLEAGSTDTSVCTPHITHVDTHAHPYRRPHVRMPHITCTHTPTRSGKSILHPREDRGASFMQAQAVGASPYLREMHQEPVGASASRRPGKKDFLSLGTSCNSRFQNLQTCIRREVQSLRAFPKISILGQPLAQSSHLQKELRNQKKASDTSGLLTEQTPS